MDITQRLSEILLEDKDRNNSFCEQSMSSAKNTGGVIEAVQHNTTGLLINPEDKMELEEAIIKLYADRTLSSKLGINGRLRVLEQYNSDPSDKLLYLFMAGR